MVTLGEVLEYVKTMDERDPKAWMRLVEMVWGRQTVEMLDQYCRQRFGKSLEQHLRDSMGIGLLPALYYVYPLGLQLELPLLPPLRAGLAITPITFLSRLIGGKHYALGATIPLPGIQILLGQIGFQATIFFEAPLLPNSRIP